jgi:uncharacterized protein YbaA (DUF1428 family)
VFRDLSPAVVYANKAIMEDDEFKELAKNMPVYGKRMFMGGFKVLRGL